MTIRAGQFDAILVGSGFGGAMAAQALVGAGRRVLVLERGGWVARGPENWKAAGVGLIGPHFSRDTPYEVHAHGRVKQTGAWHCVGGQSVFYGGASFRFRERDFVHDESVLGDSGAAWPFTYATLEPYYARAERLLGVAGAHGQDPTEPWRSAPYAQAPAPLSPPSRLVADAARRLGLSPFPIPLAIAFAPEDGRRPCIHCGTCDGYACATEAKNDLATGVLPALIARGLTLRPNTVVSRLSREGRRVTGVDWVDRVTGERGHASAPIVVLAAGALATPHLLLASGIARLSPAAGSVGRYLVRHRNAVVFGVFARRPNPAGAFDKQIAIHDFYHGAPDDPEAPPGGLGGLQQLTPSAGLVRAYMPVLVRDPAVRLVSHATGLLAIAEDEPRRENGVELDLARHDRFGRPGLRVRHAYSVRDERAVAALVRQARRVMRAAGAAFTYVHSIETFSHALGTVRLGPDPRTAPLDERGAFRGVDGLFVCDGSALPRSAGVNPSLTIAAVALKVGEHAAASLPAAADAQPFTISRSLRILDPA